MTPLPQAVRQLGLPLPAACGFAEQDFVAAPSNASALAWLGADWPQNRLVLWGGPGTGKTHLLHLWAARHGGAVWQGAALRGWPQPFADLALDDAEAAPEEALLHVLNAAAEAGRRVLLATRVAPRAWRMRLPDLASRVRAAPAVEIGAPGDDLLRLLLTRLLSDRQLRLPPDLAEWLLARLPRHPAALRDAVARLDRAALAAGGRITRPLAASVLAGMAAEAGGHEDSSPKDAG